MSIGAAKRPEKSFKPNHRGNGKGHILKFDPRIGLVVLDKTERSPESRSVRALVRDLLVFLRLLDPAMRRARATKQSIRVQATKLPIKAQAKESSNKGRPR